jgi:hypothetical protein
VSSDDWSKVLFFSDEFLRVVESSSTSSPRCCDLLKILGTKTRRGVTRRQKYISQKNESVLGDERVLTNCASNYLTFSRHLFLGWLLKDEATEFWFASSYSHGDLG